MLEINQIIDIDIEDINHLGQGVGKIDGFVVFVHGAVTGDKVMARINEVKKNLAVGEIVSFIKLSDLRVEPLCPVYRECGGCQISTLEYNEQLKFKKNLVKSSIKKSGANIENTEIFDTLGMEYPYRFRNKTTFSVEEKDAEIFVGTYIQGTHEIVDISKCMLQDELADKILEGVKNIFREYRIKPYNRNTKKGDVRHIVIRINKQSEAMLVIVTNTEVFPKAKEIAQEITKKIPAIKSVVQNINNNNDKIILGKKNITLNGSDTIVDYINNLKFVLSPHTFFQVNRIQTSVLYEKAIEFANLSKDDICFDLYCGIGTISLMAAQKCKKVYGVESVEQSIDDAKKNAILNNIGNTEFYCGKTEVVLPKLYKKKIKPDIIILDPPRKGCERKVLDVINEIAPKRVVYVSCNPATLGRDLKILTDYEFEIEKIQPVDMFCHSGHVESVCLLSKRNK